MNPNAILGKYLIKQIVINFLAVLLMVMGIVLMFEVIELLRRTSDRTDVDAWFIMQGGNQAAADAGNGVSLCDDDCGNDYLLAVKQKQRICNYPGRRRFHLGLSDTGAVCRFYGRRFEHYDHQSDFGADVRGL